MITLAWTFRLILAATIGGIIGYERHNRSKVAGVRTHSIVAMASALMTIASLHGFSGGDPSRVASSIVTGVGFLGAGIIYVRHDTVQGLTTAAGIWATSGIGIAIGAGMNVIGVIGGIVVVSVQLIFHHTGYLGDLRVTMSMDLVMDDLFEMKSLVYLVNAHGGLIESMDVRGTKDDGYYQVHMNLSNAKLNDPSSLITQLKNTPHVVSVKICGKSFEEYS